MSTDRTAEIKALIARLGDHASTLLDADPDDKVGADLVLAAAHLDTLLALQGLLKTACELRVVCGL